jgi:ADP-heptose:LPS heptosyltransferase
VPVRDDQAAQQRRTSKRSGRHRERIKALSIAALDLMITIDSMPAHLAGTLGIPTWLLLRSECDWRWMRHRSDSPWHPSMRLFRQRRPGDWSPVIAKVKEELKRVARSGVKPLK